MNESNTWQHRPLQPVLGRVTMEDVEPWRAAHACAQPINGTHVPNASATRFAPARQDPAKEIIMHACLPSTLTEGSRAGYYAQATQHMTTAPAQPQGILHTVWITAASVLRDALSSPWRARCHPAAHWPWDFKSCCFLRHCRTPRLTSNFPRACRALMRRGRWSGPSWRGWARPHALT